jgi:quercetin dioxygenase-like cupin family protein
VILQSVGALTRSGAAFGAQLLLDPDRTPGCRGKLLVHTLPPGTALPGWDPAATESVVYLLSGSARWRPGSACAGGPMELRPGDGVFSPPGPPQVVSAGPAEAAVLLVVLGQASGDAAPDSPRLPRRIVSTPASESAALGSGGFVSMGVTWLATRHSVGARQVVLATSTFSPGGSHQLHRHAHADEYFLVLQGAGMHLQSGGGTRLQAGDLVYIPAGEWHGFVTDPETVTRAVYGYLGAGSLDEAGYQLLDRMEDRT